MMDIMVEGAACVSRDAAELWVTAAHVRKDAWEVAGEGHDEWPVAKRKRIVGQVDILQARAFQVEPQFLATSRTVQLAQCRRRHLEKRGGAADDVKLSE